MDRLVNSDVGVCVCVCVCVCTREHACACIFVCDVMHASIYDNFHGRQTDKQTETQDDKQAIH